MFAKAGSNAATGFDASPNVEVLRSLKQVLMVDHRAEITKKAFLCCALAGLHVVSSSSTKQAIEKLRSEGPFDLIVVEAFMEQESVFEFIKSIRTSSNGSSIPILVVAIESGSAGSLCLNEVIKTAGIVGANDTCVLPRFDGLQLAQAIKKLV